MGERNKLDPYQERYLEHQKRKAEVLKEIIAERHSERRFGDKDIDIVPILEAIEQAPSSCDRKAVAPRVVSERDDKNFLGGVLVGGVGWVHRAQYIVLLFADEQAYKAPGEKDFMPYLDAGVVVQQALLSAQSLDYAACYVNPNVRDRFQPFFKEIFGEGIFCGAIAIGSKHDS